MGFYWSVAETRKGHNQARILNRVTRDFPRTRYNPVHSTPTMSLSPRSRFGVYEIISLVGRGGMGEVYRAAILDWRGTSRSRSFRKRGRRPRMAHARFSREARAPASLNHPNIAAIHGIEEDGSAQPGRASTTAIVMELVDGETLADRLKRGPIPLDEGGGGGGGGGGAIRCGGGGDGDRSGMGARRRGGGARLPPSFLRSSQEHRASATTAGQRLHRFDCRLCCRPA